MGEGTKSTAAFQHNDAALPRITSGPHAISPEVLFY